jgi:hypothetical protein
MKWPFVAIGCLASCGGGDEPARAVVTVDGTRYELQASATRLGTMIDFVAEDDVAMLSLALPAALPAGLRSCIEGQTLGTITLVWVEARGRFASFFPTASPMHNCTFDLVGNGSAVNLRALMATLSNAAGDATVNMTDGELFSGVSAN